MASAPELSVMMPAFNAARTIGAAIRSVQWQTHREWELIVVDDGSTDNTLDIAQDAARRDSRIKVFRVERQGRGASRNHCLRHCSAPWIAICDADDVSAPQRFERQLALARASDVDVVASSRVVAFSDSPPRLFAITTASTPRSVAEELSVGRMPIQFASALLRRASLVGLGGFDVELQRNQDFGFFYRHRRSLRFALSGEALLLYRTGGLVTPYWLVRENNFFRFLARRRGDGETVSATAARTELRTRAYMTCVVPLQYLWHALKRQVLRVGVQELSETEREWAHSLLASARGE
jgi:glycosyltransferase involved in cell wall biosynthesis